MRVAIAGATGAVGSIMLDVLRKCFPDRMAAWEPRLREMIPTYGSTLNDVPETAAKVLESTAEALDISL